MKLDLEVLVIEAQAGSQEALEKVIGEVQDELYHLAMRVLVRPEDAKDATQDILIQVITKLSTFAGNSKFRTWLYRVAVNHLLNSKKIIERDPGLSFETFRQDLESGLATEESPDDPILLDELRIACTMAMLLCLDLKHRVAYVVGDVLELDSDEASAVLGISRENFRKRLSRARADIIQFTSSTCGIANSGAKCSCSKRLPQALEQQRIRADQLIYSTGQPPSHSALMEKVRDLEDSLKTLCLQQATPRYKSPEDFGAFIQALVAR